MVPVDNKYSVYVKNCIVGLEDMCNYELVLK